MRGKISVVLRVGVSLGLVAFLLWVMRGQFPAIGATLAKTHVALFALAALLFISGVFIISYRLNLLFAGEGLCIPFGRVVQLSFIGFFFNNFMPTAVGGDIVKAYYVNKQTKETTKSFISVFMDRFIGVASFILIAVLALLLSWESISNELKRIVLVFAFCGGGIFLVILNGTFAKFVLNLFSRLKLWGLGGRLSKVYMAVHEYRNKKAVIFSVFGVSIIAQCLYFSVVYLLARSLGTKPSLATVFMVMPIVSLVSMLPSLGGLGLREGALVALLGPVIGTDNAFSVGILLLATLFILSLIGAAIYISAAQFRIKGAEISKLETYSV